VHRPLGIHKCTEREAHSRFDDSSSPPEGKQAKIEYLKTAFCLDDPDEYVFFGEALSQFGQGVIFNVNRCVEKPHCKSSLEIDNFLRNKTVFIMYNQKTFNPDDYDEPSI